MFLLFFQANSFAMIDFHKCDVDGAGSVSVRGPSHMSIYSQCNCTITANFTGELFFISKKCGTDIKNQNNNTAILLPCKGSRGTYVEKGDILLMISSTNQIKNITIHTRMYS